MKGDEDRNAEMQRLEKLNEIRKEEKKMKELASGMYGIDIIQIEELMSLYKERGIFYKDIEKIKELGGAEGIMEKLKTELRVGIRSIDNRENDFGSNKVFIEPVPPFCSYVCEALEDLMIRILIAAAVIQIILGATLSEDPSKDWIDGFSIIIAVLVVTVVGSVTNYQKETKFHELNTIQNEGTIYKVIRNGNPIDIKSDDILVGDLINVQVGDILPADLILVEGNGIQIDESALTGESKALKKEVYEKCQELLDSKVTNKIPSPLMLSGTNCVEGTGYAVVLAVGDHSQKGIIKRTIDNAQENNRTPLELKLDDIAEAIGWFGMAAGIITLVALTIRFAIHFVSNTKEYEKDSAKKDLLTQILQNYQYEQYNTTSEIMNKAKTILTNPKSEISENVLNIIMLCVSIIVVAIPEGLPLAVTLSLAFSIKKLMDQNNLVRKMHACETMGGANYICTDKTGTLTKNEMNVFKFLTVRKEILLEETIEIETGLDVNKKKNNAYTEKKIREDHQKYFNNENYWDQLRISIALNVDGNIKELEAPDQNGDVESCETKNKTDKAFIDFLYRFRVSINNERVKYISNKKFYKQIPFDSKRKCMTTFVKHDIFPTGYRLYTKGGAEKVKQICKSYIDPDTGDVKPITDTEKKFISDCIEQFNKQMLRSLYICYKDITAEEYEKCDSFINSEDVTIDQNDCVFIGVVGIRDSLRNGVKEAVIKCHSAGVNIIMVTGDNIITATAIAKDCNILDDTINLEKLGPNDIEEEAELTDNPKKRNEHIQTVLKNKPKALTGNTFFTAIGGLICSTCKQESSICKCPKTQAEAEQMEKETGKEDIPIKNDTIKEPQKFIELITNLKVMARSQPIHKYALVLGLKSLGKIVAVTGDGTNDAPALSKSDVGFSMFAGTDIAKEASDIVIMDNNFSSLVVAIIYGRNIYDNIRKFLQFQLTVNFCACLLVFICACIGNETPLTTIQMLWINLIMDSLGSLALATEPPYDELLNREPTKKNESIINGKMWKHIILQSLVQLILLLFLYLYAPYFIIENDLVRLAENRIIKFCYEELPGNTNEQHIIFGISPYWTNKGLKYPDNKMCGDYEDKQVLSVAYSFYTHNNANSAHMTIVFNVFVVYTLFNQFNCRVIDDSINILVRMGNNIFFPIITCGELILQIILIEFGSDAFKCTERGITGIQWLICVGFSAITFILSVIIKFLPLDVFIQRILDNISKGNAIAGVDDLLNNYEAEEGGGAEEKNNKGEKNEKVDEKKELNTSVISKTSKNTKDGNSKDDKLNGSIIKALRKNSNTSCGGSLRQEKPNVIISYD